MDLNVRAAARLLDVSEEEVYRLVEEGVLPHYLVQDQPHFNRVELLNVATMRRMKVSPELFEDRLANGRRLRLSELVEKGGIHRELPGADPRGVMESLVRALPLPAGFDRETALALIAGHGGLTPIGQGVAIPHGHYPLAVARNEPSVALGFPARPVSCATPDGKPIEVMFLIVSPSVRVHLDLLQKLATALHDRELHERLARRAPDAEIIGRLRELETDQPAGHGPEAAA